MKKYLVLVFILSLFLCEKLIACTGFYYANGNLAVAGNNEDWMNPFSRIWFLPAEGNKHGRIYFGFNEGGIQGGVNDRGLFFDGFAIEPHAISLAKNKEIYVGDLVQKVMEECSTVDEVIAVFEKYNLQFMERVMFFFGDKHGNSAIIEGDVIARKKDDYQVVTNFLQSAVKPAFITCQRYLIAKKIITEEKQANINVVRKILADTHQEGKYPTQYSNIYDLKNGKIYLYHFHNFENVVELNLEVELKKGKHTVDLSSLFPRSYAAEYYKNRMQEKMAARLAERKIVNVNYDVYGKYAGLYKIDSEIMPGYTIEVSCEKNKLFVELSFLDKAEILPESETNFFLIGVDETFEFMFSRDEKGNTTQITAKMYGMEIPALKIN